MQAHASQAGAGIAQVHQPACPRAGIRSDAGELYDLVSEYLQQPTLYALPASQRSLTTLILRKLLASSTYAISDTLSGLATKLDTAAKESEAVNAPPEQVAEDWEELAGEWSRAMWGKGLLPEEVAGMKSETAILGMAQPASPIARGHLGQIPSANSCDVNGPKTKLLKWTRH